MLILGINASYHESSACLIDDGVIVAAVEEERFNRVKHGKIARVATAGQLPWRPVIHDVYPTQTNEQQLSSDSSRSTLGFHTEMAFHSSLPDYVVLVGLRQDPERRARTRFAGVRRILARVDDRTRELLWSHPVEVQIEYSYARVNGAPAAPLKRVLYGDASDPYFRFDTDLMRSELPEVQAALVAMTERLTAVEGGVELEPGMLVAFDNRRCVHGRSSFQAHYDGRDRWLQRTVVRRELQCEDSAEPDRPWLITRFM